MSKVAKKSEQPKSYKAPHVVYQGGQLVPAGEPFVTADPKGEGWEEISDAEKKAQEAANPTLQQDVPLEKLPLAVLQAVAVMKKIDAAKMSKDEVIAAIKAADEPAL